MKEIEAHKREINTLRELHLMTNRQLRSTCCRGLGACCRGFWCRACCCGCDVPDHLELDEADEAAEQENPLGAAPGAGEMAR